MLSLIFWHQYHVMWYFLVIFNTKIIKSTKIIITIFTHIIVVIIVTLFCNTCKDVVFDVQKKLYNLPKLGGGGEVIWAMLKRNQFVSVVYPKITVLGRSFNMLNKMAPHPGPRPLTGRFCDWAFDSFPEREKNRKMETMMVVIIMMMMMVMIMERERKIRILLSSLGKAG